MEIIAAIVIATLILVVILFGLFSKPEHSKPRKAPKQPEDNLDDKETR